MGAGAASGFTLAVLSVAAPTSEAAKAARNTWLTEQRGLTGTVIGAFFFGSGMAISGSCPGMMWAALGGGVPNAYLNVLGGLAGVLAYGFIDPFWKRNVRRLIVGSLTASLLCGKREAGQIGVLDFLLLTRPHPFPTGDAGCLQGDSGGQGLGVVGAPSLGGQGDAGNADGSSGHRARDFLPLEGRAGGAQPCRRDQPAVFLRLAAGPDGRRHRPSPVPGRRWSRARDWVRHVVPGRGRGGARRGYLRQGQPVIVPHALH